ncbi:UNVERIFIED_ORG: SpoVK/Ycf46/Vps4 family AAA+-type ATPase [Actinomadura viridilutea]
MAAGWWASAPPQQRQHALSCRVLVLPDGTRWLFGAWARWYRLHPSDGQWYLCPPPRTPQVRMAARPAQYAGVGPMLSLPPHVIPAGPDFSYEAPKAQPFIRRSFLPELTSRMRSTVEAAAALPVVEYPHQWRQFTPQTPSTVAAAWGVMLWCAPAPVFDARMDDKLLDLWRPYRAKPLPQVDGPRWFTPPPLESLAGLYAERLRASRVDAAVVVLRTMWAVASALRDDPRFQVRADALLAILEATLSNPTVDYDVLPYGDQALVQQWLTRCPTHLVPALRDESSPGDNFRHAFYNLAEVVAHLVGQPTDPAYIEPRLVAAALLAADLNVVRRDVAANIIPWLDPEIRYTVQAVLDQQGHPLRRLWPQDLRLREPLRSAASQGDDAETLLAAMYQLDLAWCRLAGGMPARPRGFPVPNAVIARIIGRHRVRATAGAPTAAPSSSPAEPSHDPSFSPPPSFGPMTPASSQAQPGLPPGAGSERLTGPSRPDRPFVQPPAHADRGERRGIDQMQPAPNMAYAPPEPPALAAGEEGDRVDNAMPPYTELGFQRPGMPGPAAGPARPPGQGGPSGGAAGVHDMPGYGAPEQSPDRPSQEPQPAWPQQYEAAEAGQSPGEPQMGSAAPPYTALGFQRPGMPGAPSPGAVGPSPGEAAAQPPAPEGPPMQAEQPAPQGPPRTRILSDDDLQGEDGRHQEPPRPSGDGDGDSVGSGTRIMSETMVGSFDFLEDTPSPERPVHEIPPPRVSEDRRVLERYGISFVCGTQDAGELLDELRAQVEQRTGRKAAGPGDLEADATRVDHPGGAPVTRVDHPSSYEATRVDGGAASGAGMPNVLLVGSPHTGQRRLARMIALALAEAGLGDGAIRAVDAEDVRDAPAERTADLLVRPGPTILFERLDAAIEAAPDPASVVAAVRRTRLSPAAGAALIATCDPRAFRRLREDHPALVEVFRVFRLPDLTGLERRMTLLHVLAEERRVTLGASALEAAREDLERLRGPGDLVNARLVEAYLDQACQRHLERAGGASRDRLVLTAEDFAGVAEDIEPALRPPGDVDGYLRRLDALYGLDGVKEAVRELLEEAEIAAERARHGVRGRVDHNLIFVGPPGSGKTTVAGLVGGIYAALGLLDAGHVVACRPVHLAGRDAVDAENRVQAMVEQAMGGVLLIQEAYRLDRAPAVVNELMRCMAERRDRFMVICSSPEAEMEGFLAGNPAFRERFGRVIEFEGMDDRDLVRLFQDYAERDLYVLDEELRVELLARFERLREDPSFAYARTVRELFEQTVARQAARLAGVDVNAATVARLTVRDLPETPLQRMMGDLRPGG